MPIFGPPNIDLLVSKKDVRGLTNALTYKDPFIANRATFALVDLGYIYPIALIECLDVTDHEVRLRVYKILAQSVLDSEIMIFSLHDEFLSNRITSFPYFVRNDLRNQRAIIRTAKFDESNEFRKMAESYLTTKGVISNRNELDNLLPNSSIDRFSPLSIWEDFMDFLDLNNPSHHFSVYDNVFKDVGKDLRLYKYEFVHYVLQELIKDCNKITDHLEARISRPINEDIIDLTIKKNHHFELAISSQLLDIKVRHKVILSKE
jgi:hypothetical protein